MRILIILMMIAVANTRILRKARSAEYTSTNTSKLNKVNTAQQIFQKYLPDWDDLDKRPLPEWYDNAKIGILIHWGVYSVPAFSSEWFWRQWEEGNQIIKNYMDIHYPPDFKYEEFAPMFQAELFDPMNWTDLFVSSGAKYIILSSKHHDGYTLFPSNNSDNWNSVDVGPHRDLVGDLSNAVKQAGLKFGVYHSLCEWFNSKYDFDLSRNFLTHEYVDTKLWPELKQLVNDYRPSAIWAMGDWDADDDYWKSKEFLAWLYNESPIKDEVVVSDRWGKNTNGKHGDVYHYHSLLNRTLQKHKWENLIPVDYRSWGHRRDMHTNEALTLALLIDRIVSTVSCGGNVLINVGPTKEGTISPYFRELLTDLGEWLSINGEAIYSTCPWRVQNDTHNGNVWYTYKKGNSHVCDLSGGVENLGDVSPVYAISLQWPTNNVLEISAIVPYLHSGNYLVELLGNEGQYLHWTTSSGVAKITLPDKATVKSKEAWTLKISKTEVTDECISSCS